MRVSRLFGALSALTIIVGGFAAPASASAITFVGSNGKIAVAKIHNGTSTIWTMDSDGTQLAPFTRGSSHTPTWSPNGQEMVFVHTVNGQSRLHIMQADGSNRRPLTDGLAGRETAPTWTKNGQRIALVGEHSISGQTRTAVFTINRDGSQLQNISGWGSGRSFRAPSWSPDGNALVYEQYGGVEHALVIKNLKNNTSRVLTVLSDSDHQALPSWSPNGKKILFSDSANEAYTIWTDGSHRSVISDGDSYKASWSPNGENIAFIEDHKGDTISISQKDGSIHWMQIPKDGYSEIGAPVWSPDGQQLVFSMQRSNQIASDAFILDIASQKLTKLAGGQFSTFAWQARSEITGLFYRNC